jgi:hypothetical protein
MQTQQSNFREIKVFLRYQAQLYLMSKLKDATLLYPYYFTLNFTWWSLLLFQLKIALQQVSEARFMREKNK